MSNENTAKGFWPWTGYQRAWLRDDLIAGLVVALVLIPSAIAYADLAKCPPVAGLYAALGGMFIFAFFTTSKHLIVGPDAALSILVGAAVGPLAVNDPGQAVVLSTWLALLAGGLLLIASWLKLGVVADFLSSPVMLGFMNGAAVVIVASQIGKLCGIALHQENSLLRIWEWARRLHELHWPTVLLGMFGIGILVALRWKKPAVPGSIVVFAIALIAGRLIDFPSHQVAVIGAVDTRIPTPTPPELSLADVGRLMVSALGLAFLIFPEGILLGRAMANRHGYAIDADQELRALGIANLAAGLLRSFAVGGSQSRTLLNSATGGKSQMVGLIAAALVVGFMYFLGEWIATLPIVAIAAILVFTGMTLIDFDGVRKLYSLHRASALVSLLTSLGVIVFGVLPGIMVGVVLSLFRVVSQIARPHDALLARVRGHSNLHDVGDDEHAETLPGLVVYRFYGPLLFANVRFFVDRLEQFIARESHPVRQVILDARAIPEIDVTAVEQLVDLIARLRSRGIKVVLTNAHLPLRESASALGRSAAFDETNYVPKLADAVAAFLGEQNSAPSTG